MGELHGKRVLLCLDANTHSPMWHSEPRHYTGRGHNAEYRRVSMEGFVAAHGLIIHNVEGQPCTFGGPNGESNIDLTLSTRSVTAVDWKVHEGASSSDHRLITFQVIAGGTGGRGNCRGAEPTEEPVRFRDRGVDWLRFRQTIHARMGRLDLSKPAPFICRIINGTEPAEGFATTVGDAATGLLRVLCPDDDPLRDTPYHKQRAPSVPKAEPDPADEGVQVYQYGCAGGVRRSLTGRP
ncbi:hypothetical protein PYW07_012522 [Mythimna separata]|uniref:Endonuclease/exonuclease/phosphatase domain-containing protein n=1 Tax=Mythimna separata TaxID=271217 RepID=A0AAD8DKL9_MYTSE|nr:hypothetical protein PYW07_012522 [Mythimna separata]